MWAYRLDVGAPLDAPPRLTAADVPAPTAGPGEVVVAAAGVTPTELLWYPTTHAKDGSARAGAVPGHEFAGIVLAVGPGVADGMVGRRVYGMNDWFADGTSPSTPPPPPTPGPCRAGPAGARWYWPGDAARIGAGLW